LNGTGEPNTNQQELDATFVRQYLLDELTPQARERLEERLLVEDDLFAQLLMLEEEQEEELIDQYVDGEMSAPEREKFERIFLITPERQEKLNLVKDLKAHATALLRSREKGDDKKRPGRTWFPSFLAFFHFQNPLAGFALSLALPLALLGGAWFFYESRRLESEVSRLKAAQEGTPPDTAVRDLQEQLARLSARNDELESRLRASNDARIKLDQQMASLKSQGQSARERIVKVPTTPRQTPLLSLVLPLISSRSVEAGRARELPLPSAGARVELRLDLDVIEPDDYKNYQLVLKKRDGTTVWRDKAPRVSRGGSGNHIVANPPARLLLSGEQYLVELSASEAGGSRSVVGIYNFRVANK
jgi:hypothetical protein